MKILKLFVTLACLTNFTSSSWASEWTIESGGEIPDEIGALAPNGLPDGRVATGGENAGTELKSAWYTTPTTRYRHGILGDIIEGGGLTVTDADGTRHEITLPEELVFEDRTPRLVDLEGFGRTHVVTIIAHQSKGAAIAVFGLIDGELGLISQTPFIGRSNRWRNVAGIADFDGDGHLQIAEVVTPHIGGTLRFWTWKKGELIPSGDIYGFSNHFIGSREQRLSVVEDFDGDGIEDIALPDDARRAVRIIGFSGKANGEKTLKEIANISLSARIHKAMGVYIIDGKPIISVGLDDGSTLTIKK